ncbi:hypothetical protein S101468_02958 (plasmid) [Acetobacter pasteurianus subsp. pasteurianus]|uniref:Uncharacterized protein n=1 Tax=Acetobacter pasteurianus subsp. pasteurianus TaxID=481145 RepID=A0AAC9SUR6_ACEPA|nr:hypothetical protein S101468_02958 [Acetobacter pasteurianus subsp. pasteurianus]
MKHDALGELGLSEATAARPIQAAFASATAFSSGALLPVLAAVLTPVAWVSWGVSLTSVVVSPFWASSARLSAARRLCGQHCV